MVFFLFQVVKDAIASGVDGYDAEVKASVRKAAQGLRLTREAAMSIAGKAVSVDFVWYFYQLFFFFCERYSP